MSLYLNFGKGLAVVCLVAGSFGIQSEFRQREALIEEYLVRQEQLNSGNVKRASEFAGHSFSLINLLGDAGAIIAGTCMYFKMREIEEQDRKKER